MSYSLALSFSDENEVYFLIIVFYGLSVFLFYNLGTSRIECGIGFPVYRYDLFFFGVSSEFYDNGFFWDFNFSRLSLYYYSWYSSYAPSITI